MFLIDIHAHLDSLEDTPEITLEKAKKVGVQQIITIGTEPRDHEFVLNVSEKFYPSIFCTLGVHPHQALLFNETVETFLIENSSKKTVLAIGEIGLDYFYNYSPVEVQKETFRKQMELAATLKLPVQIHTRDADKDTLQIMSEYKGRVQGLIHCFTGDLSLAKQALDFGYNISFSGIVTFKNANSLREVCKFVPLDSIHVETDSPFLSPVPVRGQKNTPAHVVYVANFVADLKGIDRNKFYALTSENARQVFRKMIC